VFAAPIRAAAPPPQAITPELIDAAKKEGKIVFVQSKPGRRKLADIKLMKEDPAGEEAMAEEIKARYARLFRV
jgi:hypothetical protein